MSAQSADGLYARPEAKVAHKLRNDDQKASETKAITVEREREAFDCDEIIQQHRAWLGPLGSLLVTVTSGSIDDSVLGDPGSTSANAWVQVDGKKKFDVFPSGRIGDFSSLATRWQSYRSASGLRDGQRARLNTIVMSRMRSQQCKFEGAQLSLADLDDSYFMHADFSKATLIGALIRDAHASAKWKDGVLIGADFTGTEFWLDNDFSNANLTGAKLVNTRVGPGTTMKGANLSFADLTGAFFEPNDVAGVNIYGAKGLSDLSFQLPQAVLSLRKLTREQGLESEAKELTASLFKFKLSNSPAYVQFFANWVQGGRLTNYGLRPWNAVGALLGLIPFFAVVYWWALFARGESGIWVLHFVDGPLEKEQRGVRLCRTTLSVRASHSKMRAFKRFSKLARVALYFSFLSAFQIGYRELNLGNWISRLQQRPYILKSSGWVRSVVGVQSLLSFYLLALWVLTFFGNPFES